MSSLDDSEERIYRNLEEEFEKQSKHTRISSNQLSPVKASSEQKKNKSLSELMNILSSPQSNRHQGKQPSTRKKSQNTNQVSTDQILAESEKKLPHQLRNLQKILAKMKQQDGDKMKQDYIK